MKRKLFTITGVGLPAAIFAVFLALMVLAGCYDGSTSSGSTSSTNSDTSGGNTEDVSPKKGYVRVTNSDPQDRTIIVSTSFDNLSRTVLPGGIATFQYTFNGNKAEATVFARFISKELYVSDRRMVTIYDGKVTDLKWDGTYLGEVTN